MMVAVSERAPVADDRGVWDGIIRKHHHRVVVSLLALGLRPVKAHEIAHDTWARLYEKRLAGELDVMSFPGLAITQARFLALDALRELARERRRREGLDAIREHEIAVDPPALTEDQLHTIRAVLAKRSANEQKVFRMVYASPGLPHARIADKTGLSVQRVRQILCDVRRAIRHRLDEES